MTIYEQPTQIAELDLDIPFNDHLIGEAYFFKNKKINKPMDFSGKNYMSLVEQHNFLIQLIFPEISHSKSQLQLTKSDYEFLLREMSMLPRESEFPKYGEDYYDSYCKFFIYGNSKERMPDHVKIFNKVGLAYGFLLDNAYIVDFENKIEFFLSAVVYSNSNGVLNDDSYDYDTLTIPFLADVGRAIYEYELQRDREFDPDLSHLNKIDS